jgi:hypothetical protein
MRARALIDSASFGPDALKVIEQAYDLAWAKIAHNFAGASYGCLRGLPRFKVVGLRYSSS